MTIDTSDDNHLDEQRSDAFRRVVVEAHAAHESHGAQQFRDERQ